MAEHFTGTPAEWQTRIDLLQSQFADHAALFENDKIWHDNKSTTPVQNPELAAKIHNRVFSYGWNRLDESFSEMYTCPMLR